MKVVGGKPGSRGVSCSERKVMKTAEGGRRDRLCQILLAGQVG